MWDASRGMRHVECVTWDASRGVRRASQSAATRRAFTCVEMVRLCRGTTPIEFAPIDLCRGAAPIDLCRDAVLIDLCRDVSPIDLYSCTEL